MKILIDKLDKIFPENILIRKLLWSSIFIIILVFNPAWKSSPFFISELTIFIGAIYPSKRTLLFVALSAILFLLPVEISNLSRNVSISNWALVPKEKVTFGIRLLVLTVFVLISYALKVVAEKKGKPVLYLFGIYLSLCFILVFMSNSHYHYLFLMIFYIISIRFFHLVYNFRHQKVFKKMKSLDFFANLSFTFPLAAFVPIPIPSLLHSFQSSTDEDYLKNQKDGISLAIITCLLAIGFSLFMKNQSQNEMVQLLTSYRSPKNHFSISSINFFKEISTTYSLGQKWQYAFLHFIFYIVPVAIIGGLIVSYYRICGFRVNASTSFPYGAKTFTEYLRRINYYTSECIRDCFVYPLLSFFVFITDMRKRIFLSVLIGISIGGMFFQFLIKPRADIQVNFINHIQHSFVFFVILCVLILISFIVEDRDSKKKTISSYKLVFKVFCYLLISATIYTLVEFQGSSVYVNDINSRITFLVSLFWQ